ncbi:MAG: helix-turn-helix domain-containing protein [Commensalibacter sp.]
MSSNFTTDAMFYSDNIYENASGGILMQMNIKKWRERFGITQEALADHMKVSIPTISRWETGVSPINIRQLEKIANFFHITVLQLLSDPDDVEKYSDMFRIAKNMDKETYNAWINVGEVMKRKK